MCYSAYMKYIYKLVNLIMTLFVIFAIYSSINEIFSGYNQLGSILYYIFVIALLSYLLYFLNKNDFISLKDNIVKNTRSVKVKLSVFIYNNIRTIFFTSIACVALLIISFISIKVLLAILILAIITKQSVRYTR